MNDDCDAILLGNIKLNFLAFADDIVLLSRTSKGLQTSLNLFEKYCIKWRLSVNMTKTKLMLFNASNNNHKFYFAGIRIIETKEYSYLGIVFKKNGCLKTAIAKLNSKALKAQFSIKQNMYNANPSVLLKLYDTLIKPISLYGVEVWNLHAINWKDKTLNDLMMEDNFLFENIHNRFCKHILKVNKSCTNMLVKGELGRYPLFINVCISILKCWIHARKSPKDSLIYIATSSETNEQCNDNNNVSYANIVQKIIGKSIDFDNLYSTKINSKLFLMLKSP